MKHERIFKYILKSKEFSVPIDLSLVNRVNQEIRADIMQNQKYIIKSNITEEVLQSFIEKLTKNKLPNINIDNISQYEQLCNEFDYMKDSVQLFQNLCLFSSEIQNKRLKQRIQDETKKRDQKVQNYNSIINLLFANDSICSNNKKALFNACVKENIKLINLLNSEKIEYNDLEFVLNKEKMEAGVFRHISSKSEVFVPRSIKFQSKEYIVTRIIENSFKSSKLETIQFPEDSEIKIIEQNAFLFSSLKRILIPSTVEQIENNAFSNCYDLEKVEFSKNSRLNSINRMTFNYCSFTDIIIPSSVTQICEFAFCGCSQLRKIEFEKNSKLKIIKKSAFEDSNLESITIPSSIEELEDEVFYGAAFLSNIKMTSSKNNRYCYFDDKYILEKSDLKSDVYDILIFAQRDIENIIIPPFIKKIAKYAFYGCYKLLKISFPDCSQLESICKGAFYGSSLQTISFPLSLSNLEKGCFEEASFLTNIIISPNNQYYIFYDNQFIIGKTDTKSDIFDILIFAQKKIKNAIIPSFIVHIESSAFEGCRFLNKVEFKENSKLKSIGDHAFYQSSLKSIKIPSDVTILSDHVFSCCDKIQTVEFVNKSKLRFIDKFAFSGSSLKNIKIPSSLVQICDFAFTDCIKLKSVEFDENSKLKIIGNHSFYNSSLECFRMPPHVDQIGNFAFSYSCIQIYEINEQYNINEQKENIFKGCKKVNIMLPKI